MAQTGRVGRHQHRCFRDHKPGPLPLGALGRIADVCDLDGVPDPHPPHGRDKRRRALLAQTRPSDLPAGPTRRGLGRAHHGFVPDAVSPASPPAQAARLRPPFGRARTAYLDPARFGRMPRLDSGGFLDAVHGPVAVALPDRHRAARRHRDADRLQLQTQTLPTGAHCRVHRSRDRHPRLGLGDQPMPDRHRFRRLERQRLPGQRQPGGTRLRSPHHRAQRLHFLRRWRAMGLCRRRSACRRVRRAALLLYLRGGAGGGPPWAAALRGHDRADLRPHLPEYRHEHRSHAGDRGPPPPH